MKSIRIWYIRQVVTSCFCLLALMITAFGAGIPAVFAQDKVLSPDIKADMLINSAKNDMEAERWEDAVKSFERTMDLVINLPGEFHFLYGKALLKTGNYDDSLSSLSNYLTLVGREGKYFEDSITLIVEAKNKFDEEKHRAIKSERQLTKSARETEDGMVLIQGGCFDMGDIFDTGDSDEKPVHTVCVGDFYLGRAEVMQRQWVDITGHNPSKFHAKTAPLKE